MHGVFRFTTHQQRKPQLPEEYPLTRLLNNSVQLHSLRMASSRDGRPCDSITTDRAPDEHLDIFPHLDRRYWKALLAYFGRRVRSASEAEDLT